MRYLLALVRLSPITLRALGYSIARAGRYEVKAQDNHWATALRTTNRSSNSNTLMVTRFALAI